MDRGARNQFPICRFNFSKMGGEIRAEGTCKPLTDELYLGLLLWLA